MLTVCNGSKKGFRLNVPSSNLVRPKTSKVRKMIFDILVSVHGMDVLDIFAGSGTVMKVAAEEGRKWLGIDKELRYCKIAQKRVMSFKNK